MKAVVQRRVAGLFVLIVGNTFVLIMYGVNVSLCFLAGQIMMYILLSYIEEDKPKETKE